jgi:hypothetical protein
MHAHASTELTAGEIYKINMERPLAATLSASFSGDAYLVFVTRPLSAAPSASFDVGAEAVLLPQVFPQPVAGFLQIEFGSPYQVAMYSVRYDAVVQQEDENVSGHSLGSSRTVVTAGDTFQLLPVEQSRLAIVAVPLEEDVVDV